MKVIFGKFSFTFSRHETNRDGCPAVSGKEEALFCSDSFHVISLTIIDCPL